MAMFIFLVIFVAMMAIKLALKKNYDERSDYDERQLIIRGDAYKHGFMAIVLFCAMYTMIVLFTEQSYMADGVSTMIGILVGIVVFSAESIWRDAFFSIRRKSASYLFVLAMCVLLNGYNGYRQIRSGNLFHEHRLTMNVLPLAACVTFFIVFVVIAVKLCVGRSEE